MSSRSWQIRIQDILESACNIVECTKDLTFETFCENEYFKIKLKLIWQGIVVDLPILIKQLENLLEKEMGK